MALLSNLPKKTIIMPIGLPASGKSTLYAQLKERYGARLMSISFDDALTAWAEKRGCSYEQAFEANKTDPMAKRFIQTHYERQWKNASETGDIVFIDQTHISKKTRQRHFDKLEGFHKVGVFFDISLDESLKRCYERYIRTGKNVPPVAIKSMFNNLAKNMPEPQEFDLYLIMDTSVDQLRHASPTRAVKKAQGNKPRF
jgi:predicted kinase